MASQVRGFQEIVTRLNSYSSNVQNEVKGIVEFNLGELEREAIANAPGGGDRIATEYGTMNINNVSDKYRGSFTPVNQAIGYEIERSGYKGSVFVEKSAGEISIFIEMGTGQSAKNYLSTVPQFWRAIAARYYISGDGTILNRPFLYPAYAKYSLQFQKELKQVFKRVRL